MKVVIAGGSGMLGQALSRSLLSDGHSVTILSRNPDELDWQVPGAVYVAWNTQKVTQWAKQLEGADALINLAGASIAGESLVSMRWSKKRKQAIKQSRLMAGKVLTAAIQQTQKQPSVFVQASAIGYYGPSQTEGLTEISSPGEDFLASVVKEWEASTLPVEELGVRRVILRTGLVLSRYGGLLPTLMLPFHLMAGGPVGSGNQFMSWIHIDDWVSAVRHLIATKSSQGVYNLTAPEPLTNKAFANQLGKRMRRPSFFPAPAFVLRLALGEASTLALDGQSVLPKKLQTQGFQFSFAKLAPALADLLNKPLRFRQSFTVDVAAQTVAHYHGETSVLQRLTPFPIIVQFHRVDSIGEGSMAIFTLWFGPIPVKWVARHYDFSAGHGFTDEQLEGPFRLWVHRHSFMALSDRSTRVQDEIYSHLGRTPFKWLVSRFMWATLPILFRYRAWRTRRDVYAAMSPSLAAAQRRTNV